MYALSNYYYHLVGYLQKYESHLYDSICKYNIESKHVDDYQYKDIDTIFFLHQFSSELIKPTKVSENVFIFCLDFNLLKNTKSKHFYYPNWAFVIGRSKYNDPSVIGTKFLFSCASRNFNNYRPGKIYNYVKLKEKSYYDKIYYTKFQLNEPFDMHYYQSDSKLYDFVKQVEEEYYTWPLVDRTTDLSASMTTIDLPVYKESLFHIIAETSVEESYISEKSYKVFAAGQIPIMCGPKNAVQHLRNLGFDVFDDIVDHNCYDQEDDWIKRIDLMHKLLDNLAMLDHEKIKFDTYQRRIYNQQQLQSIDLQKIVFEPIIKQLKEHFTTN